MFKVTKNLIKAPQEHGQLMGSIVSFIFLCIINAAICRFAMEESDHRIYSLLPKEKQRYPLANLLINGDDCGFDGWKGRIQVIWESIASLVGLESSVGKTYFSRTMCTINSQVFRNYGKGFESSPYVNYGLLFGIKKSSTVDEESKIPVHKLGCYARDLKKSCPTQLWKTIKERFIYFNFDQLSKTGNIPWFLPEWLGGLGIPDDGELSERDRCYATIVKMNYKKLKPKPITDAKEWFMHDYVNQRLRDYHIRETPHLLLRENGKVHELKEQFDEAYNLFTVSLLFSEHFYSLYREIEIGCTDEVIAQKKAYQSNLRMYNLVRKIFESSEYVPPMEDCEILSERKQILLPIVVSKQPLTSMIRNDLRKWKVGEIPN